MDEITLVTKPNGHAQPLSNPPAELIESKAALERATLEKQDPFPPTGLIEPQNPHFMHFTPRLNAALAKAQGAFDTPKKNKEIDVRGKDGKLLYKHRYADLGEIMRATKGALSANGLSISHPFTPKPNAAGFYEVITTLRHESGELLVSRLPFRIEGRPQDTGTTISYWRRYAVSALLGVVADEDIDGPVRDDQQVTVRDIGPAANAQEPEKKSNPFVREAPKPAPQAPPPVGTKSERELLVDNLSTLMRLKNLSHDEIWRMIRKLTGKPKVSLVKDLSEQELTKVVQYISTHVQTNPE